MDERTDNCIVVSQKEFDHAVAEEIMHIMTEKDFSEKPAGMLALVMGGSAFARAVWMRLMGERE